MNDRKEQTTVPKKVLIMGGLGNGSVIAAAIDDANRRGDDEWVCVGFLNDRHEPGQLIAGRPVLGRVAAAREFGGKDHYIINTILRIDGQQERIEMFEQLAVPDERLATFVHPTAYVASTAVLGAGVVIMPNVSVSPGVVLGRGCLVMAAATIGHDSHYGSYCHVAAQACLGAHLDIGVGVHIGLNATVGENLTIGRYATLGMGAVLTGNMGDHEVWVGNPARYLRRAAKE